MINKAFVNIINRLSYINVIIMINISIILDRIFSLDSRDLQILNREKGRGPLK